MLSKLVLMLGLLISGIIAYFCIDQNREKLTAHKEPAHTEPAMTAETRPNRLQEAPPSAPTPQTEQTEERAAQPKASPSLTYTATPTETLRLHAGEEAQDAGLKESLDQVCPPDQCAQQLHFDKTTAPAAWTSDILKLIAYLKSHHVKNAAVIIRENQLTIKGTFPDAVSLKAFKKMVAPLANFGLEIDDQSRVAQPSHAETAQEPQKIEVAPSSETKPTQQAKSAQTASTTAPQQEVEDIQKRNIANTQQKIDTLLKSNPIYFEKGSDQITLDSKKILDRIIDIVNKTSEEIERMRIAGHTDASGSATYNKRLSQKRAESVRDYLIEKKIKVPTLEAVGYGEEKPLTANPYAKENRRVEITIEKGE